MFENEIFVDVNGDKRLVVLGSDVKGGLTDLTSLVELKYGR